MEFTYRKIDNSLLFEKIKTSDLLDLDEPQSYNPLYSRFFDMNERTSENLSLNNKLTLCDIDEMTSKNTANASIIDLSGNIKTKNVFFKFSPLLDPTKYMIGKYDISDTNLINLPTFGLNNGHAKIRDPNNSAYVDSFFSYLSSQVLHTHGFLHAVDFYGSFLAKKYNFEIDICDDLEYLSESKFFHENRGTLFKVDNGAANALNFDSRKNKDRLNMELEELSVDVLQLSDIGDLSELDNIFTNGKMDVTNENADLVFSFDISANNPATGEPYWNPEWNNLNFPSENPSWPSGNLGPDGEDAIIMKLKNKKNELV